MAVAQWVRRWGNGHKMVQAEVTSPSGDTYQKFFSNNFFSSLLDLKDFSEKVMLRSGPNSCCQQNFKCFDMPSLSFGLFS